MKGIILAGGSGTRLYPITIAVSKQLLPVYDKPMIFYPMSVLMLSGIREILVISTPRDLPLFKELLGDGSDFGISLSYAEQAQPNGLAEAFLIGRDFIGDGPVAMILGDNIFFGHGLPDVCREAAARQKGATVFAYHVNDPERYGVVSFDNGSGRATGIEEKPSRPQSNWAVNNAYLDRGDLHVCRLGRGYAWLDTGTYDSLQDASAFVQTVERRQGAQIACPEEIALGLGWLTCGQVLQRASLMEKTTYGEYLRRLVQEAN
jgi:glucose-1-phosphate thymidylyltransferase